MQSSSSSSKKTKKTKETRFSDEEKEEKSINETKTNGWRIFDVHIDASEDVGKDDFSISKPILERVCKVLHLDIEDIEDDIERKMKKTSIETILQRNDDEMMKQRIRVARKSCDAREEEEEEEASRAERRRRTLTTTMKKKKMMMINTACSFRT